jgi:ABC-2 type transport system permease protein
MQNKTWVIIEREYLSRVRKKSFLVMSLVGPILFAAMFVLPAWFATMDSSSEKRIAVMDETGIYATAFENTSTLVFEPVAGMDETQLRNGYQQMGYDAFVVISDTLLNNPGAIKILSESQITIDVKGHIARNLKTFLDQQFLASKHINGLPEIIKELEQIHVDIATIRLGEGGTESESSVEITMVISLIFSMMVYMFVLIYGTQVMRGVMEEKTNRIVEVIISSVKPFELMMGKIVGIAMVALTQVVMWIALTFILIYGVQMFIGSESGVSVLTQQTELVQGTSMGTMTDVVGDGAFQQQYERIMSKVDWDGIAWSVVAFVYFFLGGYLLYAGLFAALGAAIDTDTDSQQFVMPVMIPLILSIYVAISTYRNPTGDLAFWFSMIPFTSPVVMMARIPFHIPLWEIILSMLILAVSFIGMTYMAGRVYRTGILMYGKKTTYRELWKWFRKAG